MWFGFMDLSLEVTSIEVCCMGVYLLNAYLPLVWNVDLLIIEPLGGL